MMKTVLVIDDDAAIRDLTCRLIERRGYKVLSAADGPEALDLVARERVDLAILDVMMPEMNGFETLTRMRDRGHRFPVVMLTAHDSDQALMQGYEAGADYYLTKPLKPTALANIIDYLIGDLSPDKRAEIERML